MIINDDRRYYTILFQAIPISNIDGGIANVVVGSSANFAPSETQINSNHALIGVAKKSAKTDKEIFYTNEKLSENLNLSFDISKGEDNGLAILNTLVAFNSLLREHINLPISIFGAGIVLPFGIVQTMDYNIDQNEDFITLSITLLRKTIRPKEVKEAVKVREDDRSVLDREGEDGIIAA